MNAPAQPLRRSRSRLPGLPRVRSLRGRLLAGTVALIAVVCVGFGVASEVALRHVLYDRLDSQLRSTAIRSGGNVPQQPQGMPMLPGRDGGPPGRGQAGRNVPVASAQDLLVGGTAAGTVAVLVTTQASASGARLSQGGQPATITDAQASTIAATASTSTPQDVDVPGLGRYRTLAQQADDGTTQILALPLAPVDSALLRLGLVEAIVTGIALLLAIVVGVVLIRVSLRPLRRVAATATRVSELPLARGEVSLAERVDAADTDPRSEVGQVGAALNRLLGHVEDALAARQASETRVRHFVADASHELRTPLAAIRGYAELSRRSGSEIPPDTAHALGRVESEARRMTQLVEDLLLLARLDSGRPLGDDPVDLTALVVDGVSDAHAAGPDHDWRLDLPDDEQLVRGDGARLHQVVANLLANARAHTPPGTVVTVAVRTAGVERVLTVADDGPGIPAELLPDVFERFARGDTSRSRAAGSTGLGLAIVTAVVGAHGGRVQVASSTGEQHGTVFTVRLPAADPEAAADPDARADPGPQAGHESQATDRMATQRP